MPGGQVHRTEDKAVRIHGFLLALSALICLPDRCLELNGSRGPDLTQCGNIPRCAHQPDLRLAGDCNQCGNRFCKVPAYYDCFLFRQVKAVRPDIIIAVDNCYGEFTEDREPSAVGADVIMGSLIKNCGGGIAPTGGYVAGRRDLIERISFRLTMPGSGREVGSYAASYRPFFEGLFLAPHTVLQCLKTAMLFGEVFGSLGYEVMPKGDKLRADIVQSIRFREPKELIAFCKAVQHASPVDSDVTPEPWDMPGYNDPVIMAAGTFVQGATTELSADGPIRPPFAVYMQGSLTYEHGKLALLEVAQAVLAQGEAGER